MTAPPVSRMLWCGAAAGQRDAIGFAEKVLELLDGDAGFDNRVLLKPGVGDYLLQLNGLLRPLIQRRWAAMVAQLNRLEDSQLEVFLFGVDRIQTARIRAGRWGIQGRRCFYCDGGLGDPARGPVDHFVAGALSPAAGRRPAVAAPARVCRSGRGEAGGRARPAVRGSISKRVTDATDRATRPVSISWH